MLIFPVSFQFYIGCSPKGIHGLAENEVTTLLGILQSYPRQSVQTLVFDPRFFQTQLGLECFPPCPLPSLLLVAFFALSCRWRPYRVESTRSLPTSEVKQPRAWLVLWWGTACDHSCHRSHFGSRCSSGRCNSAVLFGATIPKSLSKVPSCVYIGPATSCLPLPFPVCLLPHSSRPTNARCFQMGANSLVKSTSRIAARHMRPPGVEPGAQAWEACMLPLHYRRHETSQETRQWLLAIVPLPFFPFPLPNNTALQPNIRQRRDWNPCGQSPMDFWSISLATRTRCHACILPPTFSTRCTHPAHIHSIMSASKHLCMTKCICIRGNRARVTSMATMHSATRPLVLLQLLAMAWHDCCHPIPHPCAFPSVLKISNDSEGIRTPAGRLGHALMLW